jgi:hypothetical protein
MKIRTTKTLVKKTLDAIKAKGVERIRKVICEQEGKAMKPKIKRIR